MTQQLPSPQALGAMFVQVLWEWIQEPGYWDGLYADCTTPTEAWALMAQTNAALRAEGSTCCASHDWCDANMAMDEAVSRFGVASLPNLGDGEGMSQEMTDLWNAAWLEAQPFLANSTPPTPN